MRTYLAEYQTEDGRYVEDTFEARNKTHAQTIISGQVGSDDTDYVRGILKGNVKKNGEMGKQGYGPLPRQTGDEE